MVKPNELLKFQLTPPSHDTYTDIPVIPNSPCQQRFTLLDEISCIFRPCFKASNERDATKNYKSARRRKAVNSEERLDSAYFSIIVGWTSSTYLM